MLLRVGIDPRPLLLKKARQHQLPVLVSANTLWDARYNRFSSRWRNYAGLDVALDSGGYVAMKKYGRFRYTVNQYVHLVSQMQPRWWAQMDYCCEPDIASDRKTVWKRIDLTAERLHECQAVAREWGTPEPMPVLQGWHPDDYCSGPIYDQDYHWPDLVGVGSVCRRQLEGPTGLIAVLEALDQKVPSHVRFHLFGVKGRILQVLNDHPKLARRCGSMDSMAWCFHSQWESVHHDLPRSNEFRAHCMIQWVQRQKRYGARVRLRP